MVRDQQPATVAEVRAVWLAVASRAPGQGERFDRMLEGVRAEARRLPVPADGCACTWHSQDAGGGHSETVPEYDPACPVHSEHLWDPRRGMWVDSAARDAEVAERIARAIEELEHTESRVRDLVRAGRSVDWPNGWDSAVYAAARIAREAGRAAPTGSVDTHTDTPGEDT